MSGLAADLRGSGIDEDFMVGNVDLQSVSMGHDAIIENRRGTMRPIFGRPLTTLGVTREELRNLDQQNLRRARMDSSITPSDQTQHNQSFNAKSSSNKTGGNMSQSNLVSLSTKEVDMQQQKLGTKLGRTHHPLVRILHHHPPLRQDPDYQDSSYLLPSGAPITKGGQERSHSTNTALDGGGGSRVKTAYSRNSNQSTLNELKSQVQHHNYLNMSQIGTHAALTGTGVSFIKVSYAGASNEEDGSQIKRLLKNAYSIRK